MSVPVFIPDQNLGVGTRIVKAASDSGDAHRDGAPGKVVEWLYLKGTFAGYMVEWDDMPGVPVYVSPTGRIIKA